MTAAAPPSTLLRFLAHFLRRQKWSFIFLSLISLMWAVEQVLFPYIVKMIIDVFSDFAGDRAQVYEPLKTPLVYGGILWGASVLAWRLADVIDYFFTPRFQANIRSSMVDYVFGHSHRYFSEHLAGSIANKIGDIVRAAHYLITQTTRFFIPNLAMVLLTAAIMATISLPYALILLGWTVVHLGICAWYARQCDAVSHRHSEIRSELQGRIVDSIGNFMTVRLFARKRQEQARIDAFQDTEVKAYKHMLFVLAKVRMMLELPCFIMIVVMLRVLIADWQQGAIGNGDVVFILTTTINLMYVLWRVGMEFPAFYREIGVCQQALTLIAEPHGLTDAPDAKPLVVTRGEIVFDAVSFEYHKGQNLFCDKNIAIPAGQKVGLVGYSGSGKSTFVNLILRLYDVERGRILIDGQDIAHVTQESLRAQISMIPQDTALFHRTLMDNIRYGRPEAGDEEVIEAARRADCHAFILQMPQGYDSLVGERGVKLSGGQRQRIAIARAILKDAPILLFDEATSSLDSATEIAIQDSMQAMMRGRTTIVIAHRLSTLTSMDRLLVFKGGAIIEDGSPQALLAANGHFAALWQMQAGGFLPDQGN